LRKIPAIVLLVFLFFGCNTTVTSSQEEEMKVSPTTDLTPNLSSIDTGIKTIHVLVALCDNKYQGIVPVPPKIGNGQDPDNNLYWGCSLGIKTYFKKSKNWTFVKRYKIDSIKLERIIFKHKKEKYYLIADAYDGKFIRKCTVDFLNSCSGKLKDTLKINESVLGVNGNARLVSYIGHDGLMDFSLSESFVNTDNNNRDAIILACVSKKFFSKYVSEAKANPLVWTTGLMSPEAYTLHDALDSYINNEPVENIRRSAAKAYSKYQKCGIRASRNLLVSGF
jgi:hypothetical protein